MNREPHGKSGHLNLYVLDTDSACTNYGEHARIVDFLPHGDELNCRIDHVHGLRPPSDCEIEAYLKKAGQGRWYVNTRVMWTNRGIVCEDVILKKTKIDGIDRYYKQKEIARRNAEAKLSEMKANGAPQSEIQKQAEAVLIAGDTGD